MARALPDERSTMADATPPQPPSTPPPHQQQPPFTHPNPVAPEENELTIVSHSNLFYWWPVWAVCFILGALTLLESSHLVTIPADTEVAHGAKVILSDGKTLENQAVYYMKDPKKDPNDTAHELKKPSVQISKHKSYGVVFTFILLVVIFITNVPLRGMWSLVVIVLFAFLIVLFAYFEVWSSLIDILESLDIRINAAGYIVIGFSLFVLWLVTLLLFDRQVYITVTPGNFKVCTEIGGGEHVYDTVGMQLEKQRSDLFRHWILGLGSGDLIVRTSGAQNVHIDLPNVLFIGRKVQQIENLIKRKSVVEAR
jgi:hypothetical protein